MLDIFCNGLPLCTAVTTVKLHGMDLCNQELERLFSAFFNTSVTSLHLHGNNIQGHHGGLVIRDLTVDNSTLAEVNLSENPIGQGGALGLGQGLAANDWLQRLHLNDCQIDNEALEHLVAAFKVTKNYSLTDLSLCENRIEGSDGGRLVGLLLQGFQQLKVLDLNNNPRLGPLGARALAPNLAVASQLESLALCCCGLGKDGVASLVPDGHVNRSLTNLNLGRNNDIRSVVGGETVIELAARCTNLDRLNVEDHVLSPDLRHRLDLLLDRKRLCTEASTLGGSPFPVLFRAVEEAHRHEHGLSAIYVILQNDGEDYFCTAHNRTVQN